MIKSNSRTYDISLDIKSRNITESTLIKILCAKSSDLICSKDNEGSIICKIESDCEEHLPIQDHIKSILSKVNCTNPIELDESIKQIYLNIGIFYYTLNCTVNITNECLNMLIKKFPDINIEATCYPCDECEEDNMDQPHIEL